MSTYIDSAVSIMQRASHEYHNVGHFLKLTEDDLAVLGKAFILPPQFSTIRVMVDAFYDYLEDSLKRVCPEHPFLQQVGAPIIKQKIKLPLQMSGMEKITKGDGSVASWASTQYSSYILSDKLDGISIQLQYKSDKIGAFTRGDGIYGEDISYLVPHLNLPKKCAYENIRGEIIMPKKAFETKWSGEFENARNLVAGLVNRKSIHPAISDVRVVIYSVLSPTNETPDQELEALRKDGFTIVNYTTVANIDEAMLSSLLAERKANSEYDLDGIVVATMETHAHSVDSPEWARKFKENTEFVETTVTSVTFKPSKDGFLKPTIQVEPTRLGGVTVVNATAFNLKFIVDNGLGPGAKVLLTRSGDVIPHIVEVTESVTPEYPTEQWVWNATGVDAVLADPDANYTVRLKRITHFFTCIKVKELSISSYEKCIDAGFDTIDKIIFMTQDDWKSVDGFAGKRGEIAFTEMQKAFEKIYLPALADATGFFGRGFGSTRFENIWNEFPEIADLDHPFDTIRAGQIAANSKGIGGSTSSQFVMGIIEFREWLRGKPFKFVLPEKTVAIGASFKGLCVTFTGFRNAEWQKLIEEQGGEYVDFGKKTNVLVYGGKKSGKVSAAEAKGIKTLSQGEFMQYLESEGI